jgi:hypothetical protein
MCTMTDWKDLIAQMVLIKQAIFALDVEHVWEYHLPRSAATEDELRAAEAHLGESLDPDYRRFLTYAGGWPAFYHTVDLFGPLDLMDGPLFRHAVKMLAVLDDVVFREAQLRRSDIMPIAATPVDLDVFVMTRSSSSLPGQVVWFAGGEIERFPSFSAYFLAMMEYNRRAVQRLRDGTSA